MKKPVERKGRGTLLKRIQDYRATERCVEDLDDAHSRDKY